MIKKSSNNIISRNKDILGGTPVFRGTRVPIKALWDYLKSGDTVEDFLEDFPSVEREQVIALIERAQKRVVGSNDENSSRRVPARQAQISISRDYS